MLIFLVSYWITQTPTLTTEEITINKQENISTNNDDLGMISWDYINKIYGYRINIPGQYYLDESDLSYIRIQNYVSTDSSILKDWEYYFEIFSGDEISQWNCEEMVFNGQVQDFWNTSWLIGDGQQGWDSGGTRKAVCIMKNGAKYYFQAVWNGSGEETVQEILQSIKFN